MLISKYMSVFLFCGVCLLVESVAAKACTHERLQELKREVAESQALLVASYRELQLLEQDAQVWTQLVLETVKRQLSGEDAPQDDEAAPTVDLNLSCINEEHLRLVNGSANYEGRLEVKLGDQWMSVCEDYWSKHSAQLVCSMMGYPGSSVAAVGGRVFGDSNNPVLPASGTCSSPAGVICEGFDKYPLRLVNGSNQHEGRVEVQMGGQWGTICDSQWDSLDAKVVCRMLGYDSDHVLATVNAMFGRGTGAVWGSNINCHGNEKHLLLCSGDTGASLIGYRSTCSHGDDVGVICGNFHNYPVRLVNGSNSREGRVQVHINGQWSTVYDGGWDSREAAVVCRQLGYKAEGATAVLNSAFGSSPGTALLGNLDCRGTEHHLFECPINHPLNYNQWNTATDAAGVRCLVLSVFT